MTTFIGYARVSTDDQDLTVQQQQLEQYGCVKVHSEKVSGKDVIGRKVIQGIIDHALPDTCLVVTKVDRIARNTSDALDIADKLKAAGMGLRCLDLGDGVDINSETGRVMYTMIATFAEMERKRILRRCNEGRAKAKAEGKHLGRHKDEAMHRQIKELFEAGTAKAAIAKQLGISRTTVYRVLDAA